MIAAGVNVIFRDAKVVESHGSVKADAGAALTPIGMFEGAPIFDSIKLNGRVCRYIGIATAEQLRKAGADKGLAYKDPKTAEVHVVTPLRVK